MARLITGKPFLILFFTLILVESAIQATTMVKLGISELVALSERVVIGKVSTQTVKRHPARKMLYTYFDVEVSDTLKGTHMARLRIAIPGGSDRNIQTVVWGGGRLSPSEEVILFLKHSDQPGIFNLVGFAQGKFSIVNDADTGEKMVVNDTRDLNIMKPPPRKSTAAIYQPPNQPGASKKVEQGTIDSERLDQFMARLYRSLDENSKEAKGN